MGRVDHETTVVRSSIALLQERFRQLERVKEMREERELLRMVSSEPKLHNNISNNHIIPQKYINPSNSSTTTTMINIYEPSRSLFFHPDLIIPQRSTSSQKLSLSLWPSFEGEDRTTRMFLKLWPLSSHDLDKSTSTFEIEAASFDKNKHTREYYCDNDFHETDVDTSLHL